MASGVVIALAATGGTVWALTAAFVVFVLIQPSSYSLYGCGDCSWHAKGLARCPWWTPRLALAWHRLIRHRIDLAKTASLGRPTGRDAAQVPEEKVTDPTSRVPSSPADQGENLNG